MFEVFGVIQEFSSDHKKVKKNSIITCKLKVPSISNADIFLQE